MNQKIKNKQRIKERSKRNKRKEIKQIRKKRIKEIDKQRNKERPLFLHMTKRRRYLRNIEQKYQQEKYKIK